MSNFGVMDIKNALIEYYGDTYDENCYNIYLKMKKMVVTK